MKKYLLVCFVLFSAVGLFAQEAADPAAEAPAASAVVEKPADPVKVPELPKLVDVVKPAVEVSGSTKLSWGIDLGKGDGSEGHKPDVKHGFKNEATWKVSFPLITKYTHPLAKDDMPVYGEVTIKDIEAGVESTHEKDKDAFHLTGKVGGIEGKLHFYGAYMTIYNKPEFKTNYADLWKPIAGKDDNTKTVEFKPGFDGWGTTIGYANKNIMGLDVGLKLGSNGNWESEEKYGDANKKEPFILKEVNAGDKPADDKAWVDPMTGELVKEATQRMTVFEYPRKDKKSGFHSQYGIGLDVKMNYEKLLAVKLGLNVTLVPAKTYTSSEGKTVKGYNEGIKGHVDKRNAFAFGTELMSEPIDNLKLKFAFDLGSQFATGNSKDGKPETDVALDMLFDTSYKWVSAGLYGAMGGIERGSRSDSSKHGLFDLGVYAKFETKADEKDASNLVKGLDAGVHLAAYRLLTKHDKNNKNTIPFIMKLWGGYRYMITDVISVRPFGEFWMETNHDESHVTAANRPNKPYIGNAFKVGVDFVPVEKVTVQAAFNMGGQNKEHAGSSWNDGKHALKPLNYASHKGTFILSCEVKF